MIKSAGEILANEIGQAVERLSTCVTPIFDVNERGEAELLGSAVLIELGGSEFLCTANHVVEANAKSTLYIDGPSKMEVLEGEFSVSKEHDVAVLKLTDGQIKLLKKYSRLKADKIGSQTQILACKYVELVGFPETKIEKSTDKIRSPASSILWDVRSLRLRQRERACGSAGNKT
jgi:hypothetical protein